MTRAFVLAALLVATPALAGKPPRPGRGGNSDTPAQQENNTNAPAAGTAMCGPELRGIHRDIVELRYVAELMPASPFKRETVGRLDRVEAATASLASNVCGMNDLDRSPPNRFDNIDAETLAGAVAAGASVFGMNLELKDGSLALKLLDMVLGDGDQPTARGMTQAQTQRGPAYADTDVDAIVERIRAAPFAEEKMGALTRGVGDRQVTSAQALKLVKAIPFAEQRVAAGTWLFERTTDKENYDVVIDGLPFSSERSQLRAAVGME
jgi:hypothetical protein